MTWVKRDDAWVWTGDNPPEIPVPWHRIFLVVSIVAFFMILLPIGVSALAYRAATDGRIENNNEAIERERDLRVSTAHELQARDARNCRADEKQDTVIVSILSRFPNPPQFVTDAINALEPPDEPNCPPFPAGFGP